MNTGANKTIHDLSFQSCVLAVRLNRERCADPPPGPARSPPPPARRRPRARSLSRHRHCRQPAARWSAWCAAGSQPPLPPLLPPSPLAPSQAGCGAGPQGPGALAAHARAPAHAGDAAQRQGASAADGPTCWVRVRVPPCACERSRSSPGLSGLESDGVGRSPSATVQRPHPCAAPLAGAAQGSCALTTCSDPCLLALPSSSSEVGPPPPPLPLPTPCCRPPAVAAGAGQPRPPPASSCRWPPASVCV
jgi:hypothetical protein